MCFLYCNRMLSRSIVSFIFLIIAILSYNLLDFNEEFIVMLGSVSILYLGYYQFFLNSTSAIYPLNGLYFKINTILFLFFNLSILTSTYLNIQIQKNLVVPKLKLELYKKLELLNAFLTFLENSFNKQFMYYLNRELVFLKHLHKLEYKAFKSFSITKSTILML